MRQALGLEGCDQYILFGFQGDERFLRFALQSDVVVFFLRTQAVHGLFDIALDLLQRLLLSPVVT
ncbi:hypothetical protein VRC41_05090 [Pseudomonas trivialis]|uniref:hypothetical protein n=1 Tax=Pseudomonas trivialis TaxID=200450 RepID=UPI0030D19AD0